MWECTLVGNITQANAWLPCEPAVAAALDLYQQRVMIRGGHARLFDDLLREGVQEQSQTTQGDTHRRIRRSPYCYLYKKSLDNIRIHRHMMNSGLPDLAFRRAPCVVYSATFRWRLAVSCSQSSDLKLPFRGARLVLHDNISTLDDNVDTDDLKVEVNLVHVCGLAEAPTSIELLLPGNTLLAAVPEKARTRVPQLTFAGRFILANMRRTSLLTHLSVLAGDTRHWQEGSSQQ